MFDLKVEYSSRETTSLVLSLISLILFWSGSLQKFTLQILDATDDWCLEKTIPIYGWYQQILWENIFFAIYKNISTFSSFCFDYFVRREIEKLFKFLIKKIICQDILQFWMFNLNFCLKTKKEGNFLNSDEK